MTQSLETIERDIELQRKQLENTIGRLRDRLSPGQLVDEVTSSLTGSSGADLAQGLAGRVRDNPIPATLLGVGLTWLMASAATTSDEPRSAAGGIAGDGGEPAATADGLLETASGKISDAGEKVRDAAGRAGETGREYARAARRGFFESLDEQPLLLGSIGLALGAALGAALPPTRAEDEWVGEISDSAKQAAVEAGKEQVAEARQVIKEKVSGTT